MGKEGIAKARKRVKLYNKIPTVIAIVIVSVMIVLTVALSFLANRLVNNMTKRQLSYVADHNASEVEAYLSTMLTFSKALSVEVQRYQGLESETAKYVLLDSLKGALSDSKIFSAYYAFEPNAYFTNTPEGVSYYAYRDGDSIGIDVLKDFDSYGTADYYLPAKQTLATHVTAPYNWTLSNGETITLVTLSTPIIDPKRGFMGVANCDIDVSSLLGLDYDLGGYANSYVFVVTGDGVCMAHTKDKALVSKVPEMITENAQLKEALSNGASFNDMIYDPYLKGRSQVIFNPIRFEGADVNWSTAFVVERNDILKSVYGITIPVIIMGLLGSALLVLISRLTVKRALAPVDHVMDMATGMGECQLKDRTYKQINTGDELAELSAIFENTSRVMDAYIQEVSDVMHQIAKGNLDVEISREYKGDFDRIKRNINKTVNLLSLTFADLNRIASDVSANAESFEQSSQTIGEGAVSQAAAIEELMSAISEINQQVSDNASYVRSINEDARSVGREIELSNSQMSLLLESMNSITDTSAKIGNIIHTIEDIAFQTNILALNAAVEAARAGEAGKGFAVVADEVRNLASKSAEAAKSTRQLIQDSVKSVDQGAKYANATADALQNLAAGTESIINTIGDISRKTDEQATALSDISGGISNISDVVQSNTSMAQENARASQELSTQAQMLKNNIASFKIKKI